MNLLEHYVTLYKELNAGKREQDISVKIQAISQFLYCSVRNSQFIIKRLEEEQWIYWIPGRGRGRASTIRFLVAPEWLILNQAKSFVKAGHYEDAISHIHLFTTEFPSLLEQFNLWFTGLFGFHQEQTDERMQDVLRLRLNKLPIAPLEPINLTLRSETHIVRHVCDTLVRYNPKSRKMEPHLAFYWETEDNKLWHFYLRKGIYFHNGQLLTARDVQYTFNRAIANRKGAAHWMMETIDTIIVRDEYTVEFGLSLSNPFFLDLLADEHLSILSSKTNELSIDNQLIGTGPYQLIENQKDRLILEVFDRYFQTRPFLDRIEYWFVENVQDEALSVPTPKDIWQGVFPDEKLSRQQLRLLEWNVQYLSLNLHKKGPFQDPDFRQWFLSILDPNQIINDLKGDRDSAAFGFLPRKSSRPHSERENKGHFKLDIAKGQELLLYTFNDQDHIEDAGWLVQRAAHYGLTINPVFLNDEELLRPEKIQEADLIHDSATISDQIEMSFLQFLFANNSFLWNHMPSLIKNKLKQKRLQFYQVSSLQERENLLEEMEKLIMDHHMVKPLYRNRVTIDTDQQVQNVTLDRQGWIDLRTIWFKKPN
ncbi:ABC transporter substrate-binding protein [Pullulanibacillus sp. KACC 23026]|uniref:ABC transporter substrate-binding protein n=1 Tax=Pullulanibacillus sp. KACC 23026 TaxID=3028315 RepID=UPI0023B14671|nr:ABC transporter substrate-binding protein [Pullulanibacillus sp. KACC 23026]WEG11845.1 ABC transporter substrate-binding protein [Pullulanibacillus sp. KACC 23026]